MAEQTLTRHDLEEKIVKRCWEDEEFRREFTADPAGTAARHLAVSVTELPKIVVHEEPAGSWHIVLPTRPAKMDELSEEYLEGIAGGIHPTLYSLVTGTAALVSAASAVVTATVPITRNQGW